MKVSDLIHELQQMPPDTEVFHLWDGRPRTRIEHVWLSKSGNVITADFGEVCYGTLDRPEGAPTEEEDLYWETPVSPEEIAMMADLERGKWRPDEYPSGIVPEIPMRQEFKLVLDELKDESAKDLDVK